jgi:DNA-binding SARP family transcriptional activator/tetratricopeptide (TPR) repeat protein
VQAEFGVLGPLYVRSDHVVLAVPAARQRVVLAALAVRARHVVSSEELAWAIWDNVPPARARVALRNYVCRLRGALGPAGGRIVTRAPGYLLDAGDDEVDLLAFTRLCRDGGGAARTGEWQRASDVLDDALGLWRGIPLADVPSAVLRDEHVPALESLRLQAIEWRLEAGLHLGRHGELVPELQALVREQPLRERFRAQLMLALYRCGRQAEALAAYQVIRRALVDELGVEPGPELQGLHQQVLTADPQLLPDAAAAGSGRPGAGLDRTARAGESGRGAPRQLPAGLRFFAGRKDELAVLTGLLAEVGGPGGTVVISAIGGTAGIGKTALAVHWAHQVAEEFPDGQLYVNLRGFDPSGRPAAPAEVVRGFLDALGTPPERIPASPEAQAALYRTLVAGQRLLIVLDNACEVDQVRPLLPGSARCLVLVTSRASLAGLAAADGAHLLALDLPTRDQARDLLALRLGTRLMNAEPEAADELIRLCARLPLALSIAAARAAARPGFPLAALTAELRDSRGRLDGLDAGDAASSMRAVFSWSYQQLSEPSARMFRLMGLHPGPDISVPAAASLAGIPVPQAQAALSDLAAACLVTERSPGRFAFHDLLRVYAADRCEARDAEADRHAAFRRALGHYLHTAQSAACALDPAQDTVTRNSPEPGVTPVGIAGCDQALAWFGAEHKVLLAVTGQAAQARFDTYAGQLPRTLVTFFGRGGHWQDLVATQHLALACAERLDDLDGQARAHRELGRAHMRLSDSNQARAHLAQAVELSQRLGDQAAEARAHLNLSVVFERAGQPRESLSSSRRALDLARTAADPLLQANACNNVGYEYAVLGDFQQALTYCRLALDLHRQADSPSLQASTWDSLGYIYRHLGDYRQATRCYLRAVDLFGDHGDRYSRARTFCHLGDTYRAAGDNRAARDAWQQALASLNALHHSDAADVCAKLEDLDTAAHKQG